MRSAQWLISISDIYFPIKFTEFQSNLIEIAMSDRNAGFAQVAILFDDCECVVACHNSNKQIILCGKRGNKRDTVSTDLHF